MTAIGYENVGTEYAARGIRWESCCARRQESFMRGTGDYWWLRESKAMVFYKTIAMS